jgi:hypothetical protein
VFDSLEQAVNRRHDGQVDVHGRHPVADFSAELSAGDGGQQQRLVAHQEVRLSAEGRGKARRRLLDLRRVRAVLEQQTAEMERHVGHLFQGRGGAVEVCHVNGHPAPG